MKNKIDNNKVTKILEKILTIFILLQPVLDCLTSLIIRFTKINYSVGFIFRGLFLLICIIYIMYSVLLRKIEFTKIKRKIILIYIISSISFVFLHLIFNLINGVQISQIITYLVKYFYFPIAILALYLLFENKIFSSDKFSKLLFCNILVYIVIMFLSIFTGTSFYSYGYEKQGFSGWFYSANELSSIISIIIPISLIYVKKELKLNIYFIYIFIVNLILIAIGTKTALISIIITVVLNFIYDFFKTKKISIYYTSFMIVIGICLLFGKNIVGFFEQFRVNNYAYNQSINEELSNKNVIKIEKNITVKSNENIYLIAYDSHKNAIKNETLEHTEKETAFENFIGKILSNRNKHLEQNFNYLKTHSISNYFFGMSFEKDEDGDLSVILIEMDFFDMFFRFGIIGMIIICAPAIYLLVNIIKLLLQNKKISLTVFELSLSILLSFMISTLVGHTLGAPAVSIYFVLAIIFLYFELINSSHKEEKI